MKKKNLKRVAAILCTACILMPQMSQAASSTEPLVYEATVKHGENVYGIKEKQERTFGYAKFDFHNGTIGVEYLYGDDVEDGTTAYALPPNGTSFKFSYIVDPSTGKLSLAIDGEICATGICKGLKNKTAITDEWYQKYSKENPTTLENVTNGTPAAQSVKITKCSTSLIELTCTRPIQYADIAKIGIYDADGNKVKIADYTKNDNVIMLKTAELMTVGKAYKVKGTNVPDIYGGNADIEIGFTQTAAGNLVKGADVTPSATVAKSWGFERRTDWHEETNLTKDNGWLASETVLGQYDIDNFYNRIYALELSDKHVKEGKYSLKWDNHPYYSTVATENTEKDWTGANMFNMWMYSEKATNETVTVLIYSDNPATPWKDGYTYPIKIDWVGEKEIQIPLEDFNTFESPLGFNNVGGIYFTTKIYNGEPTPETVLYLDDISVTYSPDYPITPNPSARTIATNTHRGMAFDGSRINHGEAELTKTDVTTPFEYEAYYKTERALYGYNPQYKPGMASFDKDGKIYIKADGTHIQYLGDDGKWQVVDLDPYVKKYGRVWDGGSTEERVVRFDNDGWAYVLVNTESGSLLLWSTDGMQTWNVYQFAGVNAFCARFEHIEGNNTGAMDKPPLILHHAQGSSVNTPGTLTIPKKTEDGGLEFTQVQYADACITTSAHTGDGNFVISSGDYAYVVYGIYQYETYKANKEKNGETLKETIPSSHDALSMSYERDGTTLYYKNGIPTFIRKVTLSDGTLSDPVFVGFGGVTDDDHNWPGVSIDSDGYIHVIMNGHHDPVCYTRSKNKNDITSWKDIEQVGTMNSYGALLIDKNNTAHILTRDASRGYRFDTSITSKENVNTNIVSYFKDWEKSYIAKRTYPYYEVARQRMSYNPKTNEIYVHYFSQSDYFEVFGDEYQGFVFTWPHEERAMYISYEGKNAGTIPTGTGLITGSTKCFYSLNDVGNGHEDVLIKSSDSGETFKPVTTADCQN